MAILNSEEIASKSKPMTKRETDRLIDLFDLVKMHINEYFPLVQELKNKIDSIKQRREIRNHSFNNIDDVAIKNIHSWGVDFEYEIRGGCHCHPESYVAERYLDMEFFTNPKKYICKLEEQLKKAEQEQKERIEKLQAEEKAKKDMQDHLLYEKLKVQFEVK